MSKEVLLGSFLTDSHFYRLKKLVGLLETHQNTLIVSLTKEPLGGIDAIWFSDSDPNAESRIETV